MFLVFFEGGASADTIQRFAGPTGADERIPLTTPANNKNNNDSTKLIVVGIII